MPDVRPIVHQTPTTEQVPPKVVGPTRPFTAKESRAILEKLKRQTLPTDILERHIAVEEAISGRPLVAGNRVKLLIDGPDTYSAMFKAIQNAKDHIDFETFIFEADEVGRSYADILSQKAAENVQVNLMYDSIGSFGTPAAFFSHLRNQGIHVLEFNPVKVLPPFGLSALTHRDHRKILVVDGTVAFTGGVNISNVYSVGLSGSIRKESGKVAWRDTDIQVEGPAVAEFQNLFMDTWKSENGPELRKGNYFPKLKREGNELVRVIGSTKGKENRDTYMTYVSAISFASESIHLTNAYFVPDEQMIRALSDAVKRGVDVKIILPAKSDSNLTLNAGRSHYSRLLKSGVKLYERRSAILHSKTAVIDRIWSSVGSTNMDLWSFLRNEEVNAVILGRDFAEQMEAMFGKDLADSDQITLKEWKKRSLAQRVKEKISRSVAYWL